MVVKCSRRVVDELGHGDEVLQSARWVLPMCLETALRLTDIGMALLLLDTKRVLCTLFLGDVLSGYMGGREAHVVGEIAVLVGALCE